MTRAAKKRAASETSLQQQLPLNKKRVVLGEITNLKNCSTNVGGVCSSSSEEIGKKKKEEKASSVVIVIDEDEEEEKKEEVLSDDPQMCVAYASDIYDYLHSMEAEEKRRPKPDYVEKVQKDINSHMRSILVDWLVEVAEEYKLVSDTLYLTISYLDRYLSSNALNRQKLQLLGVSCMLIASKYEETKYKETSPPCVERFVSITENTYTKQEVMKMEMDILKFLNFEMGNPTIKTFLRRFTRTAQGDCEKAILQLQLGYRPSDLKDCVLAIHDLQLNRKGAHGHQ
ncbi:hypothetical protein IFM89_005050 [Coptis chinensis]|uniref:Cyclin-like domain-containing protein n=1 Tax=Coptis chinensis TaxID=261450 RepID=A0A835HIF3_9MAGN|nr:hypothetical protein IFM89_005050 [Coptis chinensis]